MLVRYFAAANKLFQFGPVQTSTNVKQSVLIDFGSRDPNFGKKVEDIKSRILRFSKLDPKEYSCILMQGPPSYIYESLVSTITDKEKLIVATNGSIGKEMKMIMEATNTYFKEIEFNDIIDPLKIVDEIDSTTTHTAFVHEESSGLLNPVNEICKEIKSKNKRITTIVNGSQAYDWINLDFSNISFYFSSFHNIIQAFNGISFCIANTEALNNTKGKYLSLALDLQDQHQYQLSNPGQFRFTPPTHLIAAAYEGLHE